MVSPYLPHSIKLSLSISLALPHLNEHTHSLRHTSSFSVSSCLSHKCIHAHTFTDPPRFSLSLAQAFAHANTHTQMHVDTYTLTRKYTLAYTFTQTHIYSLTHSLALSDTHAQGAWTEICPAAHPLHKVSIIPVCCGQCNYPSANAPIIIWHSKTALSIKKQASVAHIAGLFAQKVLLFKQGSTI